MPSGGNRYDKYTEKRRTDGRLCLEDPVEDNICRLLAEGEPHEEIVKLMEGVTLDKIAAVEQAPLSIRRIAYLKRQADKEDFEPATPDECTKYVKAMLVKLSKSGDLEPAARINALKALHAVAIDERKNGKSEGSSVSQVDADKLKAAFATTETEGDGSS